MKRINQNFLILFFIVFAILGPFFGTWFWKMDSQDNKAPKENTQGRSSEIRYFYDSETDLCFVVIFNPFKYKNDDPASISKVECTRKVLQEARKLR